VSGSTDLNSYMEKFEKIDPDMAMTVKKFWMQIGIHQAGVKPGD